MSSFHKQRMQEPYASPARPPTSCTVQARRRGWAPASPALEQRWQLTAASAGQKLGAVALGAVNLVGVGLLTTMLANPVNQLALARNGLLWVAGAMPFLQVCTWQQWFVCCGGLAAADGAV